MHQSMKALHRCRTTIRYYLYEELSKMFQMFLSGSGGLEN